MLKRRQIIAQTMPQMFRKENTTAMGTKIVTNSSLGDPSYGIKPIILRKFISYIANETLKLQYTLSGVHHTR